MSSSTGSQLMQLCATFTAGGNFTYEALSNMLCERRMLEEKIQGSQVATSNNIEYDRSRISCFFSGDPLYAIPEFAKDVELKTSSISGHGVFATRDFAKDEIITLYGANLVLVRKGDNSIVIRAKVGMGVINDDYGFDVTKTMSIIGDPDIEQGANPSRLGMFINDGVMQDITSMTKKEYEDSMIAKTKCVFAPTKEHLVIVAMATKPIAKGEEVVTAYGWNYWKGYKKRHDTRYKTNSMFLCVSIFLNDTNIYILNVSNKQIYFFFTREMTVIVIQPDKTCKLCKVPGSIVRNCQEHIALDGLQTHKLGLFLDGSGPLNPLAALLIKLLRMRYGTSTAGENAHGIAYLYVENGSMTNKIWITIQQFIKSKTTTQIRDKKLNNETENGLQ